MKLFQELSKNRVKLIKSLGIKKYRSKNKLFIAEGKKVLQELAISNYTVEQYFVTDEKSLEYFKNATVISKKELNQISQVSSPHFGLALVKIPEPKLLKPVNINLVLDEIADPGNLGTIIRLADWYGLNQITCINNCVDPYSPKVVQASMGSLFRINVVELELTDIEWQKTVYGTFMQGENAAQLKPQFPCNLVIGNEANGISPKVKEKCTNKITINRFGKAESLNAGVATGILLDRFKHKLTE